MNVPNGPLSGLCKVRYISRSCTLFNVNEGTNAVRALIWEGVVDLMTPGSALQLPDGPRDALAPVRPLLGFGPESLWVAFNRFYPPELGHFESRTASPDRSHNETFDALTRGGLLQLAAEVFLFGSVFYFALRWLGLMRGRRDRNLFLAFLAAGGLLGVILPVIFDGSLRLAGIGWPAGLMLGPRACTLRSCSFSAGVSTDRRWMKALGDPRTQLLIVALFAAIVAHFVELHVGIAIVSTMTHFWILAAMLVVVGMGWIRDDEEEAAERPCAAVRRVEAARGSRACGTGCSASARCDAGRGTGSQAAAYGDRKGAGASAQGCRRRQYQGSTGAVSRRTDGHRRACGSQLRAINTGAGRAPSAARRTALRVDHGDHLSRVRLGLHDQPERRHGCVCASSGIRSPRGFSDFQVVSSPMLLVLVLFTWLVGGDDGDLRGARRWKESLLHAGGRACSTSAWSSLVFRDLRPDPRSPHGAVTGWMP